MQVVDSRDYFTSHDVICVSLLLKSDGIFSLSSLDVFRLCLSWNNFAFHSVFLLAQSLQLSESFF